MAKKSFRGTVGAIQAEDGGVIGIHAVAVSIVREIGFGTLNIRWRLFGISEVGQAYKMQTTVSIVGIRSFFNFAVEGNNV